MYYQDSLLRHIEQDPVEGHPMVSRRSSAERKKASNVPAALPPAKARKIVVNFPEPLYRRTAVVAAEVATNYSEFIRLAVEEYLDVRERAKLEQDLAEGYIANAAATRTVNNELSHVDLDLPK